MTVILLTNVTDQISFIPESSNMKKSYEPLFERKSEEFLKTFSINRLKAYHRTLQKTICKEVPWCCDRQCFEDWESDVHKAWWNSEHAYVMFVKAILKTRTAK
jgi:hypothetical protein